MDAELISAVRLVPHSKSFGVRGRLSSENGLACEPDRKAFSESDIMLAAMSRLDKPMQRRKERDATPASDNSSNRHALAISLKVHTHTQTHTHTPTRCLQGERETNFRNQIWLLSRTCGMESLINAVTHVN